MTEQRDSAICGSMNRSCYSCIRWLAMDLCVILGCGVFLCAPALASEAGRPMIGWTSSGIGAEVTVGALIYPEGLKTTYEISLECRISESLSLCEPLSQPQRTEGILAADFEGQEVTLKLTGLKAGSYWFGVSAINSSGEVSRRGRLEVPPELPLPKNTISPYEQPNAGGAERAQLSSEQRVAEYQAAKHAEEAQERAAQEAAQRVTEAVPRPPPQCVVPALVGHTLNGARLLLTRAHCKLGRVTNPHARHDRLHVAQQKPSRGSHLPADTTVAIRLAR